MDSWYLSRIGKYLKILNIYLLLEIQAGVSYWRSEFQCLDLCFMIICSKVGSGTILKEIKQRKTVSASYVYTEHIGATFLNQYKNLTDKICFKFFFDKFIFTLVFFHWPSKVPHVLQRERSKLKPF